MSLGDKSLCLKISSLIIGCSNSHLLPTSFCYIFCPGGKEGVLNQKSLDLLSSFRNSTWKCGPNSSVLSKIIAVQCLVHKGSKINISEIKVTYLVRRYIWLKWKISDTDNESMNILDANKLLLSLSFCVFFLHLFFWLPFTLQIFITGAVQGSVYGSLLFLVMVLSLAVLSIPMVSIPAKYNHAQSWTPNLGPIPKFLTQIFNCLLKTFT